MLCSLESWGAGLITQIDSAVRFLSVGTLSLPVDDQVPHSKHSQCFPHHVNNIFHPRKQVETEKACVRVKMGASKTGEKNRTAGSISEDEHCFHFVSTVECVMGKNVRTRRFKRISWVDGWRSFRRKWNGVVLLSLFNLTIIQPLLFQRSSPGLHLSCFQSNPERLCILILIRFAIAKESCGCIKVSTLSPGL